MRYEYLLLCLVLGTSITFNAAQAEKGTIIIARSSGNAAATKPTPKPTAAPLFTSTPRPPLEGAKPTPAPTKAPAKEPIVIINAPPKLATTMTAKEQTTAEKVTEALPLQTPPTDDSASPTQMETAPKQATPLQVTGFITKNGNIYEVTDKDGIGMIESRQNPDTEKTSHVCNYGSVVIYSDVPCDEVTNVRIGEVQHKVINTAQREEEEALASAAAVEPQQSANAAELGAGNSESDSNVSNANSNPGEDDNEFPDFDDGPPKPQKRKRVNKNPKNKRRRNGNRQRPNAVRQGGQRRRQQQQQAQRLRPQQQRRRQQQQQYRRRLQQQQQKQQRQQQKRRRNSNGTKRNGQRRKNQRGGSYNRRRYSVNDIYDEE